MLKIPFAFYLSALALMISSCSFNPPLQKSGVNDLQGIWQQDSVRIDKALITYSTYKFRFSCDSFFVQINSYSKVNYGADSCMKTGKWAEYARGNYELNHDTLHLKGQFCNADQSLKKESGCFRNGNYEEQFKVKKITDSVYQYLILSAITPFKVHLIKKTSCIPKPL